jgi:hypothetical protein
MTRPQPFRSWVDLDIDIPAGATGEIRTTYPQCGQPAPMPPAFDVKTSACLDWVGVIDEVLHHLKAILEEEITS